MPRAVADITEAYFYFEQKRQGLGDQFLSRIEEVFSRISETPEIYATISETGIRKARLRQFPFVVGYLVEDEETILVLGVLHGSRNPADWTERFK